MISDYCRGAQDPSEAFQAYVAQRRYFLHTPAAYGNLIEEAGFTSVVAEDRTEQFVDMLVSELARTKANQSQFVAVCLAVPSLSLSAGFRRGELQLHNQWMGIQACALPGRRPEVGTLSCNKAFVAQTFSAFSPESPPWPYFPILI